LFVLFPWFKKGGGSGGAIAPPEGIRELAKEKIFQEL
jgi:hypothetical protein